MRRFTIALCSLPLLATAVMAEDRNQPPLKVDPLQYDEYRFVPQFNAWCMVVRPWTYAAWGGCVPEYTIPPDKLRTLREKAGLNPEAPVYIPPTK